MVGGGFVCPHCGAAVPGGRPACPECGSDDRTGWRDSEEVFLASVDLPDDFARAARAPERGRPSFFSRPAVRTALTILVVLVLIGPVLLGLIGFFLMPFIGGR